MQSVDYINFSRIIADAKMISFPNAVERRKREVNEARSDST